MRSFFKNGLRNARNWLRIYKGWLEKAVVGTDCQCFYEHIIKYSKTTLSNISKVSLDGKIEIHNIEQVG